MSYLRNLLFLSVVFTFIGCSASVDEEAPATEAPEMSADEKTNMDDQMKMMKDMREKQGEKNP